MRNDHVAVIGGGIAGASAAYHLSGRTDRPVVVYERGPLAGETTARSAAFFGFYGSDLEPRLKRYGMALYNEFLADPRAEPRYELVGRLRVALTELGAEALRERVESDWADDPVAYHACEELRETVLLPELDHTAVTGATYRPGVGYHRPHELAREFVVRAEERGVRFEVGARVTDLVVDDGRVRAMAVESDAGDVRTDVAAVVVAAGP